MVCRLLIVCLFLFPCIVNSQKLNFKWSDKQLSDNKTDGFFDYFINSNSKYIYAKHSNFSYSKRKSDRKIKLASYDKKTMDKVSSVELRGFTEKKSSKKYKALTYYRTLVFDSCIYVFWRKEAKSKEELYVETFSPELKQLTGIKKIFESENFKSMDAKSTRSIFLMREGDKGDKLLVGYETPTEPGTNLKIRYKLISKKLETLAEKTVELPAKYKMENKGITSWYNYAVDGYLYITNRLEYTEPERAAVLQGGYTNYFVISKLDLITGAISSATIKSHDRNIHRIHFYSDSQSVKFISFFTDLKKDTLNRNIEGICTYRIKGNEKISLDSTFVYFDSKIMQPLFKEDEDGGKVKTNHRLFAMNVEKQNLLDDKLKIESFIIDENKDMLLFCSRATNFTSERCKTKTKCDDPFFCYKENLLVLKSDSTGNLKWAKNIDRRALYNEWDIIDIKTIKKDDKYYVVYGSDYDVDAKKKSYSSKKSKKEYKNNVTYAVFDTKDGAYTKQELNINEENDKAKRKVNPINIGFIDDVFYIHSDRKKYKPIRSTIYGVAGFFTCGAMLIPLFADSNNRRQVNYTGLIKPVVIK